MEREIKNPIDICLENGFKLIDSDDGINGGNFYILEDEKGNQFEITIH